MGSITGRMGEDKFELQNIPVPIDPGKSLRPAFLGKRRRFFTTGADYSQIELRQAGNYMIQSRGSDARLDDCDCRPGDRVEATAAWGEFVPKGARGTVSPAGDRLNIVWDVVDGERLPICRTTGPFRVISAVDALAELA